tara:strand:- start:89 stop:463 length:375 start_codon:yes stop_codon:yes gene_type:complete
MTTSLNRSPQLPLENYEVIPFSDLKEIDVLSELLRTEGGITFKKHFWFNHFGNVIIIPADMIISVESFPESYLSITSGNFIDKFVFATVITKSLEEDAKLKFSVREELYISYLRYNLYSVCPPY